MAVLSVNSLAFLTVQFTFYICIFIYVYIHVDLYYTVISEIAGLSFMTATFMFPELALFSSRVKDFQCLFEIWTGPLRNNYNRSH